MMNYEDGAVNFMVPRLLKFTFKLALQITNTNKMNSFGIHQHYRKTSNINRTLVGNNIVDNSDVVGASPVGAAPTPSSFST